MWPNLKRVKWAAVTFATLAVAALLWLAAEQHYQGCLDRATTLYQPFEQSSARGGVPEYRRQDGGSPREQTIKKRQEAIEGCSRLPF